MYSKLITGSLISLAGISGGAYATFHSTQETISDSLNGEKVVSYSNKSKKGWDKLIEKIKGESVLPKSNVFIKLKEDIKKNGSDENLLKNECQIQFGSYHKNIFWKTHELIEDFKKFCTIKVEEIVESSKIFSESDKSGDGQIKVKEKLTALRQKKTDEKLNGELERLSKTTDETDETDDNENISSLIKECARRYKENFEEENDIWKLTESYCIKQ